MNALHKLLQHATSHMLPLGLPMQLQRCAHKLEAIKRDQTAIRARQYAASSCPICLEDFGAPVTAAGGTDSTGDASGTPLGSTAAAGSVAAAAAAAGGTSQAAAGVSDEDRDASADPSAPLLKSSEAAGSSSTAAAAAGAGSSDSTAASIAGSSSSSQRGSKSVRKPLVLRCGHAFCEPCISQ